MKIHHLRNATMVIETDDQAILVDPMLGEKGSLPPFAKKRAKPSRNPLVELPENAPEILEKVTTCLITHSQKFGIKTLQHTDHLDSAGEDFLRGKNIPVATLAKDAPVLARYGLNIVAAVDFCKPTPLWGGEVVAVPAAHGHTWVRHLMANGAGYVLRLPNEPSVYISGDTVYTNEVDRALKELKPDYAIMAAGTATLDVSKPILMVMEELMRFAENAPSKVIANHLEALNHCPTTREQLRGELERRGLSEKVFVPEDGEALSCG